MNRYFGAKMSRESESGVDFGELVSRLRKLQCEDERGDGESGINCLGQLQKTDLLAAIAVLLSSGNESIMLQRASADRAAAACLFKRAATYRQRARLAKFT